MHRKDGKFVDAGGIKTHYYEKGVGKPLVLFHGGAFGHPTAADSAWDWSTNFDALAEYYRVIAVDKLGQGFRIFLRPMQIIVCLRLWNTLQIRCAL